MFRPGDRVRWSCDGDDGLPLVRYGFVGAEPADGDVQVVFDGELSGALVSVENVDQVTITSIELCLQGDDLVSDPGLRQGLVRLWQAEAELAGLELSGVRDLGTGLRDSSRSWALAEIVNGSATYVVRAWQNGGDPCDVHVRADRTTG